MPQTHDSQPQPPHVGVLTAVQPVVTVHGPQSCGQFEHFSVLGSQMPSPHLAPHGPQSCGQEPQLSLAGSHLPSPQTGAQAPQS